MNSTNNLCPSDSIIDNEFEQTYYWAKILQYWKLSSKLRHFPAANPISIEKQDFARLKEDDFIAALKTDGVRYLLLITCKPNSAEPIALMIDRKKVMYEIEVWAYPSFFTEGSLYDGELVWESNSLTYVVFDVMLSKGIVTTQMSYRERLNVISNTILCVSKDESSETIENMLFEDNTFISMNLKTVPKTCVPKASVEMLWNNRFNSSHKNDGIIFTKNNASVGFGTSTTILKWKPSHSVDVELRFVDNMWKCRANTDNSDDLVEIPYSIQENELISKIKSPCIMECEIQINEDTIFLVPERERTDKQAPNTLTTIEKTIKNAAENITIEEIISNI